MGYTCEDQPAAVRIDPSAKLTLNDFLPTWRISSATGTPISTCFTTPTTSTIFSWGKGEITGDVVSPAIGPKKEWGAQVILVDTHVVVWLALDHTQLSKKARAAIDDARQSGDGLAISGITLLELATLASKGRIRLNISLEFSRARIEARFTILPISGRACSRPRETLI